MEEKKNHFPDCVVGDFCSLGLLSHGPAANFSVRVFITRARNSLHKSHRIGYRHQKIILHVRNLIQALPDGTHTERCLLPGTEVVSPSPACHGKTQMTHRASASLRLEKTPEPTESKRQPLPTASSEPRPSLPPCHVEHLQGWRPHQFSGQPVSVP